MSSKKLKSIEFQRDVLFSVSAFSFDDFDDFNDLDDFCCYYCCSIYCTITTIICCCAFEKFVIANDDSKSMRLL